MLSKQECLVTESSMGEVLIPDPNDLDEAASSSCPVPIPTTNYFFNVTVSFSLPSDVGHPRNVSICHFRVMDECFSCQQQNTLTCQPAKEFDTVRQSRMWMELFQCQNVISVNMNDFAQYDLGNTIGCWINKVDPSYVFIPFPDAREQLWRRIFIFFGVFVGAEALVFACNLYCHAKKRKRQKEPFSSLSFDTSGSDQQQDRPLSMSVNSVHSPYERVIHGHSPMENSPLTMVHELIPEYDAFWRARHEPEETNAEVLLHDQDRSYHFSLLSAPGISITSGSPPTQHSKIDQDEEDEELIYP